MTRQLTTSARFAKSVDLSIRVGDALHSRQVFFNRSRGPPPSREVTHRTTNVRRIIARGMRCHCWNARMLDPLALAAAVSSGRAALGIVRWHRSWV